MRRAKYLVRSTPFFFATKDVAALQACRPSLCEKPANLERVRRIPSDTWRPRSIAKSTLNRNRSTEIQKLISADMRRQKQTSRFRYARSNLDMWSTCALKKKHLRRIKPAVFTDVNNPVAGKTTIQRWRHGPATPGAAKAVDQWS